MKLGRLILFLSFLILFHFSQIGCSYSPYAEARYLMGTLNEVRIFDLPREKAVLAADKAFKSMELVDKLMSHYKETSEISAFKKIGALEPMRVSRETFAVLSRAQEIAKLSGGAFDVTLAPLVRRWGFFDHEPKPIPTKKELENLKKTYGYSHLILNAARLEIQKSISELEIDLGGIAKGYAVDLALDALKAAGVKIAMVDSGGNIGFLGLPKGKKAWDVGIKNPLDPLEIIGFMKVKDRGIATSGNYEQFFQIEGKRYAHILDPRSGWPVEKVLSVTVVAPTAMDADALSTALFVLGPEKGVVLADQIEAAALFITEKKGSGIELILSSNAKFFTNHDPRSTSDESRATK